MQADSASEWLYPTVPAGVVAVSTTRAGGVSKGRYAGLNLGSHVGDVPEAVAQNRALLVRGLGCSSIQWLTQVHGTQCLGVSRASAHSTPEADAGWTTQPGVAVAVLTADCVPVVFAAKDGSAVAVAHAGWRGLAAGVLGATLRAMPVPASAQVAWIGPAIGVARYEVGEDVLRAASLALPGAESYFTLGGAAGKYQFDLVGLTHHELRRLGIDDVSGAEICCASDERFYSYRRDGVTGRMATLAWLSDSEA
jgi:YfiH family protein